MATKLSIYKSALRYLGNAAGVASLTEASPARYALDDVWQEAGEYMFAKGLWNFAIRSSEFQNDEDVEPLFGYQYAFSKPTDWVRTVSIGTDPTFLAGFEDFADETAYWYADSPTLYIRYVSNDDDYGWNIGAWREPFAQAFAAYLAFQCALPISSDKGTRTDLFNLSKALLSEAKALDAVDERVAYSPAGRLVQSRLRRGSLSGTRRGL
ncbi:hypothetical protein EN858_14995 [Mesorhizobium sp. M4B.F.Ca.ET.215.01.1.1]|uniref:hypothetical protein n=1 Tax=unclassified Mesorhizobium TaxID=325217 RepID=UPI001093A41F|nr:MULTISPECIES: hypothetical protein [unclassified Mesorhizobium]TGQ11226.1 hypothetical protein EN858_14995 [Mesorhizobium sp. M4B.F.Ca.ET.215.01.1.1]TGR04721.1 hypothetical protein EN846_13085 [Mesorhizobium sp. M4B.F.Ca.ET.203.01.1.1]